jgi:hypothetical protein
VKTHNGWVYVAFIDVFFGEVAAAKAGFHALASGS